jgi:uncharacterized protein (TIGR01777 family)
MRILIAGSSGFLGTHLVRELGAAGHDLTRLVRRDPGPGEARWDPYAEELDQDLVEKADVVVNLAGSPTLGNPHSKRWASELERSRVTTTRLLAEAIARGSRRPAYLAGNGISYYGDHGDQPLSESADSRGDAFLTGVTRTWEAATEPASRAGARVCVLRTAPVLDARNAPLKQQLLQFKAGVGGRVGSGRQYFPVISLRDWIGAVRFLVEHDTVSGPVNLCCPQTPTNADYTRALADLVGRPAFLHVPSFVIGPVAGRMAPEVLGSLRTVPEALLDAGFRFADPDVTAVLAAATHP